MKRDHIHSEFLKNGGAGEDGGVREGQWSEGGWRQTISEAQDGDLAGTRHANSHTQSVLIVMKFYVSEPTMSCIYTLEVTPAISSGIFQVVKTLLLIANCCNFFVCVYMPCHMHSPFSIRQPFPVQKQVHPGSGCGPVE